VSDFSEPLFNGLEDSGGLDGLMDIGRLRGAPGDGSPGGGPGFLEGPARPNEGGDERAPTAEAGSGGSRSLTGCPDHSCGRHRLVSRMMAIRGGRPSGRARVRGSSRGCGSHDALGEWLEESEGSRSPEGSAGRSVPGVGGASFAGELQRVTGEDLSKGEPVECR